MIFVPEDCFANALSEFDLWFPAEFGFDLVWIEDVAFVVLEAIRNVGFERSWFFEGCENGVGDFFDGFFDERAYVIRFTYLTLVQDYIDRASVIENVDPFAPVLAALKEGEWEVAQGVGGEERDDLFWKLVGTVVIGAVADGHRKLEGVVVGHDDVVGGGFGSVVRRFWHVGVTLAEEARVVEFEFAKDFTGGNVMETFYVGVFSGGEEDLGAEDVGFYEDAWIGDGAIVVGFGGEVYYPIDTLESWADLVVVANIRVHEAIAWVCGHVCQVCRVAGVGERIKVHDVIFRMRFEPIANEV